MKRRPKPQKHTRLKVERRVHRNRLLPCRRFRVYPDPSLPFVVEVRIARNGVGMRDAINWCESQEASDEMERELAGMVRSWHARRTPRGSVVRPGQLVARMYLNVKDLRERPSEIVAHECGHAAMAWARYRVANLNHMAGEEVMCHALGQLVKQVNRICYAHGVWL